MKAGQLSLVEPRPDRIREAAAPLREEQPEVRLYMRGPECLSDAELVSIIAGTSMEVARELLHGGLAQFVKVDWRVARMDRQSRKRAVRLAASMELHRRISQLAFDASEPVTHPESLAKLLIARYSHHVQERLGAVFLDAKNRVICEREIYIGTVNSALVSTRELFAFALHDGAVSLMLFHNHPSGDTAPSSEDLLFTRRASEAGRVMGIEVVDHLVLGVGQYLSMKQRGYLG